MQAENTRDLGLALNRDTRDCAAVWKRSELVRKYITEPDLELRHQGFEFVEGQMMFAAFKSVKCRMGEAGLFAELGVREFAPRFTKEFTKLNI